jgi:cell division protease FtsH
MPIESWIPIGFELPDGASCGRALFAGPNWQIVETKGGGNALIATDALFSRWLKSHLVDAGDFHAMAFGAERYRQVSCRPSQKLFPLSDCQSPSSVSEAHAFAKALRETRTIDPDSPLQGAIYIEKFTRLLPVHESGERSDDEMLFGFWLTGGVHVPAMSIERMPHMLAWLGRDDLRAIVTAAGFEVRDEAAIARSSRPKAGSQIDAKAFELPGRTELASFFNEYIVDIVRNKERYNALGIDRDLHRSSAKRRSDTDLGQWKRLAGGTRTR